MLFQYGGIRFEAERPVKADRCLHVWKAVQQHFPVTSHGGEPDGFNHECSPGPASTPLIPHIEPLQLASTRPIERTHANAADRLPARVVGEEESTFGRGVFAWQRRNFLLNALET